MTRQINKILIHCSDTPPSMDIGAAEIRTWHIHDNGWDDIGYHGVIRRDGTLESGRPMNVIGAHCRGQNADSIGICLVGGRNATTRNPECNFTLEQWRTLERTLRDLLVRFEGATIHGHNEFSTKACPCFDVRAWWNERNGGT